MKKRIISFVLALVLASSLLPAALAAPATLKNFAPSKTYTEGQFTDVTADKWYAASIQTAFELGLVNGNSATTFNPTGNISLAETIALACRLHNIYNGGTGVFEQGAPWYQVYVDYAIEHEVVIEGLYSDYTAKATRADFATIMSAAFPDEALEAINDIRLLPDVTEDDVFAGAVYRLYNAGILTGSDKYGTFNPTSNIQRSEVATIVTRMADPSLRKTVKLAPPAFNAAVSGSGTNVSITWDSVSGAEGYQIMGGPTAEFDSESWGQYGISSADAACTAELPDTFMADGEYWIVYALDYDPINGEKGPDDVGVIGESAVLHTPAKMYVREELKSENYTYLAGTTFRSVRRSYPSAVAQGAYVYAFENLQGHLCVLVDVRYKIQSNWSEVRLYNMTTGSTITDPSSYYQTQASRAYGATKIQYINMATEVLGHHTNMLRAISSVWSTGVNNWNGAYVTPKELNL